jgi:hypothetical protein
VEQRDSATGDFGDAGNSCRRDFVHGHSEKKTKGPEIGLRQAKRLCQLDERRRLEFIAEGLPVTLQSAQSFWQAGKTASSVARPRSDGDRGICERTSRKDPDPPKLFASNLNRIVGWFYDHLARLIYAEAVSWKPMHLALERSVRTGMVVSSCHSGSVFHTAGVIRVALATRQPFPVYP